MAEADHRRSDRSKERERERHRDRESTGLKTVITRKGGRSLWKELVKALGGGVLPWDDETSAFVINTKGDPDNLVYLGMARYTDIRFPVLPAGKGNILGLL